MTILNDFQTLFQFRITGGVFLLNLVTALVCGLIIALFYRQTYRGPGYLSAFVNTLVLLPMITAVVIMVIDNNVARAFGLVGAMSIIRFRTAVKNSWDIMFIFFSLAIGMATGVGLKGIAVAGTLFIGLVTFLLTGTGLVVTSKKESLLQFKIQVSGSDSDAGSCFLPVIDKYCRSSRLLNSQCTEDILEFSYYVDFKDPDKSEAFLREFNQAGPVIHVNLFFDEEQF